MESPTIAVVGGNKERGEGDRHRCCVVGVGGDCDLGTTVAVGSRASTVRGDTPERLALRAASFTIICREEEVRREMEVEGC